MANEASEFYFEQELLHEISIWRSMSESENILWIFYLRTKGGISWQCVK